MIRKSFYILTAVTAMLFASCEKYDHAISDIEDRLDKIEGTSLTTIDQQVTAINGSIDDLKGVDVALHSLIDNLEADVAEFQQQLDDNAAADAATKKTLEDEIAAIKANIEKLKTKDTELEGRIAALETYVDIYLQGTKDWANATFATLDQYEEVLDVIADIKGDIAAIADIEAAYTKAIADAIAASEAAMKEWVNGELQKVYSDISALRIELEALAASAATDKELAAAVTAQQAALEQAKKDLTAAYEAAIKKAIEDNNGVIDDAIAAAITAATNNLQSEITNIKSEITSIKSRLDALEKNFANRIQSLVFVPQYSDGKILMDYTGRTTQAHFRISPASIAKLIAVENVKAFARYTNDPTTRAYEPEFPLVVVSVTGDETGMLEVNLKEDSENLFDTDFWAGKKEAVIYIQITDDNGNNVVSDAIPMMAHGYGSNEGNQVYGFGDGNTYTGEITE